jgi:triphosphoribosyl-dephospho-CoA synthase
VIMQMQSSRYEVDVPSLRASLSRVEDHQAGAIALSALNGLYRELCAYPKPGLVSVFDNGSHEDMDASTFMHSILSLQSYFHEIAFAGIRKAGFEELRRLGLGAESSMLKATGNINTHRGAIFTLGIIAAAAGYLMRMGKTLKGSLLSYVIRDRWSNDILLTAPHEPCSHGAIVAARYGVAGARQEAAAGFPRLFNVGLPALQDCLRKRINFHTAVIQTFFCLMAEVPDNNLLFRGGHEGLLYAQAAARSFLDDGGVYKKNWRRRARTIHREFVIRRLSPGGSADLLAATLFVQGLQARS